MQHQQSHHIGWIAAIIIVAALSRLLFVLVPNFSPIGAIALFGAAYFSQKWLAFVIPLAAMWVSDLLINNMLYPRMFPEYYDGNFAWGVSWWVYGAFAVVVLLGFVLLKQVKIQNVLLASVLTAIVFFLVTNFGVWAGGTMYPKTAAGLGACYVAAIPFFWNTLLSNILFSAVLFAGYNYVRQQRLAMA